jgi:phosphoribosylanthranilate isomerase
MGLKTIVKVSHITNLSDARYCAGVGVRMIGFCLDRHLPYFVEASVAQEIAAWIAGVSIVGEISTDLEVALSDYPLAMVEVNATQHLQALAGLGAPLIFRILVDNIETLTFCHEILNEYAPLVEYFIVESNLLKIDAQVKDLLKKLCTEYAILIGFGINNRNVIEILEDIKPAGIALNGDFEEFSEILELIEVE